jgi:glycosyltransferase involved in cell wall biosynthesis
MKVIYDVSAFGHIQRWPNGSAGINRVVDNLARALIHSGKCSLNFSAMESELHYYTIKYVEDSSEFQGICLPHSAWRYQSFWEFPEANRRANDATGLSKIWWRMVRKLMHHSANPSNPKFIQERSLNWADVFHSPFYAIPNQVRGRKNLRIFITVYDLIAILFPQYFESDSNKPHPCQIILDSIRDDDWVVCISQKTKEDLCNHRKDIDPRRVFVTPLAASEWFYPCRDAAQMEAVRSKYKIPAGQYLLSLCTFEPRKNLAHLIRCFSQLVRQEPLKDLRLVLAGSLGWKYESIFAELTRTDGAVRERIIIAGRVADEDMAALYSGATAFIYPSLYEGFGLPPLEAMQCGTPVITSNTSSLPEVVGNAGIMVDPRDTDGLCQAMLRLVTETDLRQMMSKKSLEQAGRFSWAHCADQTIAAYETAVNSKS